MALPSSYAYAQILNNWHNIHPSDPHGRPVHPTVTLHPYIAALHHLHLNTAHLYHMIFKVFPVYILEAPPADYCAEITPLEKVLALFMASFAASLTL